jgi:FMN phosphatase YigB (HAD superfamily)
LRAPIEAIAFDLWNTLIGCVHPVNPMNRLVEVVRAAGAAHPMALVSECTMREPLAGIAPALRALERRLGRPLARGEERARLLALWAGTTGCNIVFDDVAPALARLKETYRIGVISNTQSFDLEFWRSSAARALLEVELLSYEVGLLKPDARLFQRFARAVGVAPERILMIGDNSRDDVEGARAAGLQAARICRPISTLSHREPAAEDAPLGGLDELERRLRDLRREGGGREGAGPPRAAPRRARGSRKKPP